MKLSDFRQHLDSVDRLTFILPDGTSVPPHFHITEAGLLTKHFIDCGKTIHLKKTAVFQLWSADDTHHRLKPSMAGRIIDASHRVFDGEDPEVEIEYQMDTVSKFGLEFDEGRFRLTPTYTDCLAKESCDVAPASAIAEEVQGCCTPGGGCC
ncbi:DUF6428 family protein [Rhodohalobacter mucosus]|uniref:Uncharacterized protein n=1 Tax=Rhodohalobacter mucosus TaxID=2079485 RepID=A0A316TRX5_9BACT|nr:DUF6428 family protein [Rhodohalobacter mucosus]PWN06381.1 hypothetical protein DDZ15_11220 [Rhodohalobacter mucosus]